MLSMGWCRGARSRNHQAATASTLWETGALRTGGTAGSCAKGLVMDFGENNKPVEVYISLCFIDVNMMVTGNMYEWYWMIMMMYP